MAIAIAINAGTHTHQAHTRLNPILVPEELDDESYLVATTVLINDGGTRLKLRHASIGTREIPAGPLPRHFEVPPVLHKFLGVSAGITVSALALMLFVGSLSRWVSGAIFLGFLGITLSVWTEIRSWETGDIA